LTLITKKEEPIKRKLIMKKSNHAITRCQQRGIRNRQVELILKYGINEGTIITAYNKGKF